MRIARVIGTVVLSQSHPALQAGRYRVVVPMSLNDLRQDTTPEVEELVAYDQLGAGLGDRILLSDGAEAAQPFLPEIKPVDAYNAAILDDVQLEDESGSS